MIMATLGRRLACTTLLSTANVLCATGGAIQELARGFDGTKIPPLPGHPGVYGYHNGSPEGCSIYSQKSQSVVALFQLDNVSNASTGLRLWQTETDISGLSWTDPHPMLIPQLRKENVTAGTHIAPGNGIELQSGPRAGRLLNVLILETHCTLDVVVYSDNGGTA
jgi:hypothetical protein